MSNEFDGRRRLLSTSHLYVDVDRDLRDIANDLNKDDIYEELEWSLKPLRAEFKTKDSELLFKKYQSRLQHRFFTVLLMLNIIVNFIDTFWFFLSKTDTQFPFSALLRISALIVYISFLILTYHSEKWLRSEFSRALASITVMMAMVYAEYGGFLFTVSGDTMTFRWKRSRPVFYLIICSEILLPFPSRVYSSISTALIVLLELIVTIVWPHVSSSSCQVLTPDDLSFEYSRYKYLYSDLLFYLFAALVAYYVTFLLEIVNRRAFLDHRRCVESKFKLNFEKDQQEQLLSSCLPKHLMHKVRADIRERFESHFESSQSGSTRDSSFSRPFSELYIEKFDNVTILYADIVNSMLLTQSLESPQALVETLNGLFGRFDNRAEANNCLRIKLLGDCYYCVCGIPEYDENHALNSINMGLDMIEIIKALREENKVNVDMRIGINSGTVLSGLLGLKKWQYDIWSIDSMKASQMEHDGKPGYVHITQTTLDLVPTKQRQNFFIQENHSVPDETTYLICKQKPQGMGDRLYVRNNSKAGSDPKTVERFQYQVHSRNSSLSSRSSRIGSIHFSRRRTVLEVGLGKYREMLTFANQTLSKAIDKMPLNIKRQYNGSHPHIEINPYFLHFIPKKTPDMGKISQLKHLHMLDREKERLYFKEYDQLFPYYLYCSGLICLAIMSIRLLALYDEYASIPQYFYTNGNIVSYVTLIIIAFSLCLTRIMNNELSQAYRIIIWLLISSTLLTSSTLDLVNCSHYATLEERVDASDNTGEHDCLYKWSHYYTYANVLSLTSICMFIRINLWLKFSLSTISILAINFITQHHNCSVFLRIDKYYNDNAKIDLEFYTPRMTHMQYLFVIYLMFYVIDRQIEYISRLDFLWTTRLKREKREAQVTREVNQLLLKNILPIHVAQRYLFNSHDPAEQLYYEAYNSCAVMFAAIQNFFKFYTETELNDDGLQYLQILHEIICEFDRLLMLPQFRLKIEKIKTIGSTYMAASGLQPGKGSIDSVISAEEEIENLIVLIRFAQSMMKSLERINVQAKAQSSNEMSFQMRIGIAMGPVIAGVVGAVKPQYDIWGDTVNVASRMDTNGISGKIHITEEVAKILLELDMFKPVCRGTVNIKGKGKLVTYLIDCDNNMTEELYGLI